jgi:hypothetical protein
MQDKIIFSPPDLPGYDFMNELMAKLASMVSSRSGATAPEDALEGEIWVKTETYLDEDDNELQRMTLMIRRNGADVDILSEFKADCLLQRVIDATAEKLAGSLVLRNDVGAAALDVIGNADTATKFKTAMQIKLTGAVSGAVNIAGDANVSMETTAANSVVVPAGVIVAYYNTVAPAGWFICDGNNGNPLSEEQQTANPNLTILLKLWNNGAALLPDLRGYFIRGYSADIALDPNMGVSRGFASKQNDAMRRIVGLERIWPGSDWKTAGNFWAGAFRSMVRFGLGPNTKFGNEINTYLFDSSLAPLCKSSLSTSQLYERLRDMNVNDTSIPTLRDFTDDEVRPKNMALNYIIKGG